MSYVVWFDEFDPSLAARLGGKCTALGELTRAGLDVPPGFAVTTDAYVAARGPLTDRLRVLLADAAGDPAGVARTSATMRDLVEGAPLPDDLRDAVAGAYTDLCRRCGTPDVPVAVRSSAVGEDAPERPRSWPRSAGAGRACSRSG
jgi:pyruvate, water dikinase